jgi:Fur family peroxide stress response transcriptional regulator
MSYGRKRMVRAFREEGQRITRQREAIFDYLTRPRVGHPSARRVYEDLRKEHAGISMATVYNTMGALVRLGLIKVIEFESGDNRYETNMEPHINLICLSCGTITDLDIGPAIHVECAREKLGFRVSDFRLEYYGRCVDCADPAPLTG